MTTVCVVLVLSVFLGLSGWIATLPDIIVVTTLLFLGTVFMIAAVTIIKRAITEIAP